MSRSRLALSQLFLGPLSTNKAKPTMARRVTPTIGRVACASPISRSCESGIEKHWFLCRQIAKSLPSRPSQGGPSRHHDTGNRKSKNAAPRKPIPQVFLDMKEGYPIVTHYKSPLKTFLFPLDGAGRFRGDVENDSIDVLNLVGDSVRNLGEDVVWHPGPVGGHRVFTRHGS